MRDRRAIPHVPGKPTSPPPPAPPPNPAQSKLASKAPSAPPPPSRIRPRRPAPPRRPRPLQQPPLRVASSLMRRHPLAHGSFSSNNTISHPATQPANRLRSLHRLAPNRPPDAPPLPARAAAALVSKSSRRPGRPKAMLPHWPRPTGALRESPIPPALAHNEKSYAPAPAAPPAYSRQPEPRPGGDHLSPAPTPPPPPPPRPTPPRPPQPGTARPPRPAAAPCARTSASRRPTPAARAQGRIAFSRTR